ncbi:MAG: AmmeMemoRadiSam system protein A [Gammaproteobacteria bacterium]|nr:AmmeMemoRadiSam system protein A [Gammaproteobacteria bacterium]
MSVGWGAALTGLARAAIAEAVGMPAVHPDIAVADRQRLSEPGAAFVTLKRHGQLRGCIGSLEAVRPLQDDLTRNAVAAALHDPRFLPMTESEVDDVSIEVSLLSKPKPIDIHSEAEAILALRPGLDGVILELGSQRATFLPQVWAELPNPHEFLMHLRRKAGLPIDHWDPDIEVSVYTVEHFSEVNGHE